MPLRALAALFCRSCERDETFSWAPSWLSERRAPRAFSPLMLRILAVNVMALAILVGSLLYLGRYRDRLIATELDGLMMQARMSASAIAEGAVVLDREERNILSPLLARLMIRRLVEASATRTRLYDDDDVLLADSRILLDPAGKVQARRLLSPHRSRLSPLTARVFGVMDRFGAQREYPIYPEEDLRQGDQYSIVQQAREGGVTTQVWRMEDGSLLLSAAAPVQRYRQVLGVALLTRPDAKIGAAIHAVRIDILKIFGMTLLVTLLLSFYLARAIATPLKQLAQAAENVRQGQTRMIGLSGSARLLNSDAIPDFGGRRDEIGDLSVSLRAMTSALAKRIGAIENFAADVAHEIKNPLTSLRSAVETVGKVKEAEQRDRLLQVIRDDVDRLDRLITDISCASRLDAELTRDEAVALDVVRMVKTLVRFYAEREHKSPPSVRVEACLPKGALKIEGIETRLVQVLRNLIDNALSFSPENSRVVVSVRAVKGGWVDMVVEDEGGGIPEGKLEAIFDRFYTERPKAEKFGTHSGLGLSISRQIVEAHHGRIWAENRHGEDGRMLGARFTVRIPALSP